ncbi:hypothetical protein I5M27_16125 [Adhaeribacter sp. BT258]|uniref:Secreted protein n=1 Tax=Adhaeribacter terrigena TaxID=2793070 RepID=A0ABS1C7G2_9BACT|nr:hypothetical protein [Adhaeribacter terrigena]MBK0404525.1 hypothetical protein [Adhaeribacter terrigena]
MKRWIIYVLIIVVNAAGITASAHVSDRDRDRDGNSKNATTLKMKPRKLSKQTAKLRQSREKDRKKHMAYIKKSNQQRNKQKR